MLLDIKPIENDRDYADGIAIRNSDLDHMPLTVEEARSFDAANPSDLYFERQLGRDPDGVALAYGMVRQERAQEGKLFMADVMVSDLRVLEAWHQMRHSVEQRCRDLDATTTISFTRSDRPSIAKAMEDHGYALSQTNPVSCLDVQTFCAEPFQARVAKAEADGFKLLSLGEYARQVGERWKEVYWRFVMDVLQDVPMPVPFVEEPLDEFVKWVETRNWDLETRYVALDGDRMAAVSEFEVRKADPRIGSTYLTGARREYRRRGLATALKAKALAHAKSMGLERLYTDNEESNPMYVLNLELGFKHAFDWLIYKKEAN